ncbi:MAG: ATP-dependent RNA helicase HrpA, partial [Succinivibrio sp.]|nr:ATP-dependent RNA helicase HrpA [Succinivibrio sp.]
LNIDFLLGYLKKLLVRRPDLKLVITSATIDVNRFSTHFDDAPIIEVSGRTYPVEVVYMPPEDTLSDEDDVDEEADLRHGVLRAVKYLLKEHGYGDILVFLPGERDIMDMAAFLNRQKLPAVEILPLYARLATSEQNKIFAPHQGVRIVLSTNVAETSLTVPGIRYVVDPGLARISRYSPRTKVQRLPVEKISQASANQRKGRCGRISEGVCVRLYSEEDFKARPEFTDPEILRTNLAAVILQMVALRLGDLRKFPFIDAPEERQVTDGMRLLEELGAISDPRGKGTDELELTRIGVMLAKIPADPRLSRMLLEAARYNSLNEVLIIVSALAVMDPRENPVDKKEQSRQYHHRFDTEKSDFLAYLRLYQYINNLQKDLSNSALRKTLKKEFISYLRVREWFDVLRQLRASCQVLKLGINEKEADYESIHRAILTGLLSQIGHFDDNDKGLYLGARGVKFYIHPSSVLNKKHPKWLCAAELNETSRLFARTVAEIDPLWLEFAAAHLVKRNYSDPHWSKKQGAVIASMNMTLYGLTFVSGRTVQYTKIDPVLCRTLLIRDGLVGGDIDCRFDFYRHNRDLVAEVVEVEDKVRRRDLLVDSTVLEDFYNRRIPDSVTTQRAFEHWWTEKQKTDPAFLNFTLDLIATDRLQQTRQNLFPDFWQMGPLKLKLSYVFSPGDRYDGVSVHIPVTVINQIVPSQFVWQVEGLRSEFLSALIKSLPKRLRRNLIPAPDYARALNESLGSDISGNLYERAAKELTRMGGEQIAVEDFDKDLIPAHLFVTFIFEDLKGKEISSGKNYESLADKLQGKARETLQQVVKSHQKSDPVNRWSFGTILKEQVQKQGSIEITAYPALTDKGPGVSLELYDSQSRQLNAMWKGQRKLLSLGLHQPTTYLEAHLPNKAKLAMYYQPIGEVRDLVSDIMLSSIDSLMREYGAPVWEESAFTKLQDRIRANLNEKSLEISRIVEQILYKAHDLKRALKGRISFELARTYADVGGQLDALVFKGFVSSTKSENLKEIPRYLEAALQRLSKAPRDINKDLNCMRILEETTDAWRGAMTRYAKDLVPSELLDIKWLFEELRVSFFAQQLGVKVQISSKRILNEINRILKEYPPLR